MISSFLLVLLLRAVQFGTSYTMKEIFQDSLSMNMHELVPFRGPILKDIWLSDESKHRLDRHEEARVCQQLFTKGLETVNVQWPPPKTPPPELLQAYTMGGKAELVDWYIMVTSSFLFSPFSDLFFNYRNNRTEVRVTNGIKLSLTVSEPNRIPVDSTTADSANLSCQNIKI
jgi:hypothetical protein